MKLLKLIGAAAAAASIAFAPQAFAQQYPDHPIHFIVPASPGSLIDQLIRIMAPRLSAAWGQAIVVDNRPGASQSLGVDTATRARPDGYTLLITTNAPLTITPALIKVSYDPLRDLEPVVFVGSNSLVLLTSPKLPVKTVPQLIALAKSEPGKLMGGTSGNGSTAQLSLAMLNRLAGINIMSVPYKGGPDSINAVLSNQVNLVFSDPTVAASLVKDGRLRMLASTGAKRSTYFPDLPTLAELGVPNFDVEAWVGIFAPRGTPQQIVDKVNAEFVRELKDPKTIKRMLDIGLEVSPSSPQELGTKLTDEVPRWRKLITSTGAM